MVALRQCPCLFLLIFCRYYVCDVSANDSPVVGNGSVSSLAYAPIKPSISVGLLYPYYPHSGESRERAYNKVISTFFAKINSFSFPSFYQFSSSNVHRAALKDNPDGNVIFQFVMGWLHSGCFYVFLFVIRLNRCEGMKQKKGFRIKIDLDLSSEKIERVDRIRFV